MLGFDFCSPLMNCCVAVSSASEALASTCAFVMLTVIPYASAPWLSFVCTTPPSGAKETLSPSPYFLQLSGYFSE